MIHRRGHREKIKGLLTDNLIAAAAAGIAGRAAGLHGKVLGEFRRHIEMCHRLNIPGFPALLVQRDGVIRRIPVEFNDPELQLRLIEDAAA